jgi:hypothetical protein
METHDSQVGPRAGWLPVLAGQVIQRGCPSAGSCGHKHCALRVLCKCAAADMQRATALENRFWIAMLGCGLLALGLWLTA